MHWSSATIVVDKSFCQAVKAKRLAALSMKHVLPFPTAFYYEVFTTPETIRKTLTGLGEFRRAHLPSLLRRETKSGAPTREADLPRLRINPKMLSLDWRLSPDQSAIVEMHECGAVKPSIDFWKRVIEHGVIGFSADELTALEGDDNEFLTLCQLLRDRDRVRGIADQMKFPYAAIIDESWLHYRQFQTWVLQGLILSRRYRHERNEPSERRIEHDVQDLEYLILGLHTRKLATADTSLKVYKASMALRFKLLDPEGELCRELLTPESA